MNLVWYNGELWMTSLSRAVIAAYQRVDPELKITIIQDDEDSSTGDIKVDRVEVKYLKQY